jgi:hypothetical protein
MEVPGEALFLTGGLALVGQEGIAISSWAYPGINWCDRFQMESNSKK